MAKKGFLVGLVEKLAVGLDHSLTTFAKGEDKASGKSFSTFESVELILEIF